MLAALFLTLLLLVAVGSDAYAQVAYPSKTVRLVLGFPAGTNVDVLARPLAQRMTEMLGQPIVVDNRAGATGLIANELELFRSMAKVDMLHVPYKGGNLALNDLLGGRIDLMFYSLAIANTQISAGAQRLRGDFEKYGRIVKTVGIEPE